MPNLASFYLYNMTSASDLKIEKSIWPNLILIYKIEKIVIKFKKLKSFNLVLDLKDKLDLRLKDPNRLGL